MEVYSQHSQLKALDGNCTHLGGHAQGQAQDKLPDPIQVLGNLITDFL